MNQQLAALRIVLALSVCACGPAEPVADGTGGAAGSTGTAGAPSTGGAEPAGGGPAGGAPAGAGGVGGAPAGPGGSGGAGAAGTGGAEPIGCGDGPACDAGEICDVDTCRLPVSCRELNEAAPSLPSAAYALDVDGAAPLEPFSVYCDMEEDGTLGAGWTLFLVSLVGLNSHAVSNSTGEVDPLFLTSASPPSSAKLADAVVQTLIQTQPAGAAVLRFEPLEFPNANTTLYVRGAALEWTLATGANYLNNVEARRHDSTQWGPGIICKGNGCSSSPGSVQYCFARSPGETACPRVSGDDTRFTFDNGDWVQSGGRDARVWIR